MRDVCINKTILFPLKKILFINLLMLFLVFPAKTGFSLKKEDVIGTWRIISFSEMELPEDQKTFYVFSKDGSFLKKMIIADYIEEQRGRWSLEKNDLVLSFPVQGKTIIYNLVLEGDELVLRRLGMTTTLKKSVE